MDSRYPSRSFRSSAVPHSLPHPPACYSQIPNHSSHIFLQSPSPSFTSLHPTSLPTPFRTRPSAAIQPASKPPIRPSLELVCSPARVPGAPSSHASSQRRPGSPPPASSVRTARRRSAAPPLPESRCQARTRRTPPPRTPGPLPAPPQPLRPSPSPPPPLSTQPVCKEGSPRCAGSRARRVAPGTTGRVGRLAGGGGRAALHSGSPAAKTRTDPAPANNRLRLQRSASYRRRRVVAEARGSLGNGVYTRPTPKACWELEAVSAPKHSPTLERPQRPWRAPACRAAARLEAGGCDAPLHFGTNHTRSLIKPRFSSHQDLTPCLGNVIIMGLSHMTCCSWPNL